MNRWIVAPQLPVQLACWCHRFVASVSKLPMQSWIAAFAGAVTAADSVMCVESGIAVTVFAPDGLTPVMLMLSPT